LRRLHGYRLLTRKLGGENLVENVRNWKYIVSINAGNYCEQIHGHQRIGAGR
jgi:hypothetical protein